MKKIFSFALVAAIVAACSSGPHYVINGKIEGADSVMFLLQKREAGVMVDLDSAMAYKDHLR
ncbi:MAG: lipoprotein [Bacteroidales bacterium]|nr:lipoprotein [Bacteroidales bacterium]